MNAIEFRDVIVEYPAIQRRTTSLKEWMITRARRDHHAHPPFQALRGISLEVPRGQAIGIVGRNGAGKSTLLRVAAGIVPPSSGLAITRGAMAPLIELGTGFDMELTGRENVYFNGSLLGRSRAEMKRREEEIVHYADVQGFIDAPLRTYSTGMVARLGFAIATSIEADVLLLDEILSVGDAAFREKCDVRIREFLSNGSTIVIVSHELASINELCTRAIWIEQGELRDDGPASDIVFKYQLATGMARIETEPA